MSQRIGVVTRSRSAGGRQGRGSGVLGAAVAPQRSEGATAGAATGDAIASESGFSPMPQFVPDGDRASEGNVARNFSTPDPEVTVKPARRRFTAAYKAKILREAESCRGQPGKIGEMVRREGLYTAHLSAWRKQRDAGALDALSPKKRGRKSEPVNPLARRVAEQERDIRRLTHHLKQAETIIEVQKKVSELLGIRLSAPPLDEND